MEGVSLSLRELFDKAQTCPVDIEIVNGFRGAVELQSLESQRLVRVHCVRDEPVFVGRVDGDREHTIIPLHCEEQFELLPPIPELDDKLYETARDVLEARPFPSWLRVTQSWDGGEEETTIQEDDELENVTVGEHNTLGPCFTASRIIRLQDRVIKERVSVPFHAAGMFTTRASQETRYRAIDMADRNVSLPQRVRVHCCGEVPQVPLKAKVTRFATQRTALCSDLQNGRLFILPEDLRDVSVRIRRLYSGEGDPARYLYPWMHAQYLPRVGVEPFDRHVASRKATSNEKAPDALTVLISRRLTESRQYNLPDYRTFSTVGIVTNEPSHFPFRNQLDRAGSRQQENTLAKLHKLQITTAKVQYLKTLPSQENTNDDKDEDEDDYENPELSDTYSTVILPTEDDVYEDVDKMPRVPNHPQPLYAPMHAASASVRYTDPTPPSPELPSRSRPPNPPSSPKPPLPSRPKSMSMSMGLKDKVQLLRNENKELSHQVSGKQRTLDELRTLIDTQEQQNRCEVIAIDREVIKEQLESMSNAQAIQMLKNLSLSQYTEQFINANVQGYELGDCDTAYLQDVGLRPAHAAKLLTVLQGKLPRGRSWGNLLQ